MASSSNFEMPRLSEVLLTLLCVAILYKIVKYLVGKARAFEPPSTGPISRRLGLAEEAMDLLSTEKSGTTNICLALSITSKQSLVHQHVHDALVLLAKRQPMLRAVIATMADGKKYFEIKGIKEAVSLLDVTTSKVNASHWKDVWFEYTSKQRGNVLLWRVVILQELYVADSEDYKNTLMFKFDHSCTDGVSSLMFCKQFLSNMNELANGTISVDQDICSLDLLQSSHEIVTRGRIWHALFYYMLPYGLRLILRFLMRRFLPRLIAKKPDNPYYEQFPPNNDTSKSLVASRMIVKVYTETETMSIIQACKANNCTVTGAITAVAHLAFCELMEECKCRTADVELESTFSINNRRFCDPKPHENYVGFFVYIQFDFYMKYVTGANIDFWKLAEETTRRIKDCVKRQEFIAENTVLHGIMEPKELCDLFLDDNLFLKTYCNFISSFGSFTFGEHRSATYKLEDCVINNLCHATNTTFDHYNYTINSKMTWQIVSNVTVRTKHAERFADLCFDKLIKVSRGEM